MRRREELQGAARRGYADAVAALTRKREATDPEIEIPSGMLDAIVAAGLVRPEARPALEAHYCVAMPAMLAAQIRRAGGAEERLFAARVELRRMPRLRDGLDALFSLVASAGLSCAGVLGAPTPAALADGRTWAEIYTRCHFGRSMPMLYAYPGDLTTDRDPLEWIEARYVGPLIHELSHFRTSDPPAPANVHEALAAWIGSEAWPGQMWPEPGAEDALPGGAYFAAVGGWLARASGEREVLHVQAGLLDLREALGAPCAEALRLYGCLTFLETGAPHLLADAFHPGRWWKLVDLHRDPSLAKEFHRAHVTPLLESGLRSDWDAALDDLNWRTLPSWRDEPREIDQKLARRAERALQVRAVRRGMTFHSERATPPGPLALDEERCELAAPWPVPDAVGAPASHPYPPALVRAGR
ncbi:MAG: hypothetical protein LC689_04615 [Myxococcales bacterium]|nr:hypothetical protein [Myxococcales bacterium]